MEAEPPEVFRGSTGKAKPFRSSHRHSRAEGYGVILARIPTKLFDASMIRKSSRLAGTVREYLLDLA